MSIARVAGITVALCLSVVGGWAQQVGEVKGRVVSKDDSGIEGITIRIRQQTIATVSGEGGWFVLQQVPYGNHQVELSGVGYEALTHAIAVDRPLQTGVTIVLAASNRSLGTVDVSGRTAGEQLRQSGYNVNVIETRQYANTNADINQILNRSTGVKIREQGGLGSNYTFAINGLSGNHIKFFIDGIPIEAYGSGMSFNNIPVNIAERIEVYKGVVPAHFAGDALGGAVNIVTNRDRRRAIDVSYSYGSFNTHRTAVSTNYTEPETGLQVNFNGYFNHSDNDYLMRTNPKANEYLRVLTEDGGGFDTIASARRFHDAYRSYMGQLEVGVSNKKWADLMVVGVTYNNVYNEQQTGATQERVIGHVNNRSNSLVPNIRYRKARLFTEGLSLSAFANLANDKSVVTDTSSYRVYRWDQRPDAYFAEAGELATTKSIQHYSGYNNLAQAALNYELASDHLLMLNYTFNSHYRKSYNEIDPYNHSRDQSNRLNKHLVGLSYNHQLLANRWTNSLFGKYYGFTGKVVARDSSVSNQAAHYFGYGVSSSFLIIPAWGVKASYEHAYRLPGLIELYGNGIEVVGNPGLTPENSDNYNLGTFYNRWFGRHRVGVTAGVFYRDAKNYIHSTPALDNNSGGTFTSYYNFGGIKVEGAEVEVQYALGNLIRFTANLSYENAVDREKFVRGTNRVKVSYGSRLPDQPWLYGNTDFAIGKDDLLGQGTRLEFNWFMQFVNEYAYTWSKLAAPNTKYYIPAQWIQNAALTYSIQHGRYNVTLESRNLTDQIAYDNSKLQKPGRAVFLKFRYNLNIK